MNQHLSNRNTNKRIRCHSLIFWFVSSWTMANLAFCEEARGRNQPSMSHEQIFDADRLLEVDITIAKEDWDKLRFQSRNFATALRKPPPPTPYTWFKANVTIDGHFIENVAVRKKGFLGSQDSDRPSLKIKFDEVGEQHPIQGLDRLTLNNNKQDRGCVSQALTYKLFHEAKLPAPRSSLAKVTLNGESLGIYTNVESVKEPMLVRNFGDATGKLYEGTVADLFPDKVDALEAKQVGENDTRKELLGVANLVAEKDVDIKSLEKHLDVDEFLKFWAMESLIGFWDGYTNNQNNYFVYFHAGDSKLHFMPWGADAAFSYDGAAKMFKNGPESVHTKSLLANRLYHTEGIADRYRDAMRSLLDEVWDEKALIAEIDRIEQLVEGSIHESQQDSTKAMEQSREFIRSRRRLIDREFQSWPKKVSAKPRKPFYSAQVGEATGSFTAKWLEKEPSDPYAEGTAELDLTLDGKKIKFSKLGVYAILSRDKGFDGKRAPTVVFVGKRVSNKIKVTFIVGTERGAFTEPSGEPTGGMGAMFEGIKFWEMRIVGGSVILEEAGMNPGDTVRGSLKVDVVQFKGDMR